MSHPAAVDEPSVASEPAERRSVWDWDAATVARVATTLVVIQALWRAWIAFQGYFTGDDFVFAYYASVKPLDLAYLLRDHIGHLMPGAFALAWLLDKVAPLNYTLVVLVDLALQALTALGLYKLLVLLFGPRKGILLPLAFFLFLPLDVDAFLWWAAALNHIPMQLGMVWATYCHARFLKGHGKRWWLFGILWFLVALSAFEKAVLIVPVLLSLSILLDRGRTVMQSLAHNLVRHWYVWTGYVTLGVLYAWLYTTHVHFGFDYSPQAPTVAQLASRVVGTTVVPSLFGGPWHWIPIGFSGGAAAPPGWAKWLSWELLAVLVVATVLLRRFAARAWIFFAVYLTADIALIALGRLSFIGPVIGLASRYVADAAFPATLTLAFIALPLIGETDPYTELGRRLHDALLDRKWLPLGAAFLAANAFLASAVITTQNDAALWSDNPARAYMTNAQKTLAQAPKNISLLGQPVPDRVLNPLFTPFNDSSHMLAPYRDRPPFSARTTKLYMFDDSGALVPAKVSGVDSKRGPLANCGYAATADRPAAIPLTIPVYAWDWTMRIGYLAGADTTAHVRFGAVDVPVTFKKGLNDVFFPVVAGGSSVYVDGIKPGAAVCIDKVTVGLRYPVTPKKP